MIERKPTKKTSAAWRLKTISVEGLFGKYDYPDIPLYGKRKKPSQINFLYGDNGSGKTSILRLTYALLSGEKRGGNKTFLAKTEFKRIHLAFDNGSYLEATRNDTGPGSYRLTASTADDFQQVHVSTEDNFIITDFITPALDSFTEFVDRSFPSVVFVTDLRTFRTSDSKRRQNVEYYTGSGREFIQIDEWAEYSDTNDLEALSRKGLSRILRMARSYISDRALRSTARASQSSGNIYLRIAKTIVRQSKENLSELSTDQLVQKINDILPEISRFQSFGYRDGDSLHRILDVLENAPRAKQEDLVGLLTPYISSLEERLDQNREIFRLIETYEHSLNSFLSDKAASLRVGSSIIFRDNFNNRVLPESLSSGERHLVHLLTIALLSNQSDSIILIDEPELSLNYKWQSRLVENLAVIAGESSQFLMATHSFEIISEFRESIRKVQPVYREQV